VSIDHRHLADESGTHNQGHREAGELRGGASSNGDTAITRRDDCGGGRGSWAHRNASCTLERGDTISEGDRHLFRRDGGLAKRDGFISRRGKIISEGDSSLGGREGRVGTGGSTICRRGTNTSQRGGSIGKRGGPSPERGSLMARRDSSVSEGGGAISE